MAPGVASADHQKYLYSTPFFHPKNGTNSTLHFTNADSASQQFHIRRYNAVGGLLSATNVTIQAKATVIAFAGANSGAQMHIEVWAASPAIIWELFFIDTADVTRNIPTSEIRMLEFGSAETGGGEFAHLGASIAYLRSPIDTLQTGVSALGDPIGALTPKLDAIAGDVSALRAQPAPEPDARVGSLQGEVATVKSDVGALKREVATLRRELRSLRRVLLKRLPKRR